MSQLAYVKLSEIHLWIDNPRTGTVDNELSEIIELVKEQKTKKGNKLFGLANSIIKNGIFDPIGVLKNDKGFMVVKEGNRRIACLEMLNKPDIIPAEFGEIRNTFSKMKKQASRNIFTNIPARIFDINENEEMEQWIELRHNGLQKGQGLASWNPMQKQNWNKYRGRNTPLLNFLNYLKSENILSDEQMSNVSKTNWERILGTVGRSYLGMDFKDGKYIIVIDKNDFKKRISKTVNVLKGQSVGIVYDNDAIKIFFDKINFSEEDIIEQPDVSIPKNEGNVSSIRNEKKESKENAIKVEEENNKSPEISQLNENSNEQSKNHRHSTKISPLLSNIICDLKSSSDTDGIIRLTTELKKMSKRKDYTEYPIAAAMLMRSLLEQSLIYYLKKRNKWNKFYSSKKYDPTLTEIIDKYYSDTDIFAQDKKIERGFHTVFETPGLKDYFNMLVHHPDKFAATKESLDAIVAQSGYSALIQYIIDYKPKI
jgi:hypothetical protein